MTVKVSRSSQSNNTVMNRVVFSLVICAMLLGLCPSAEAQQAKTFGARVGYLSVLSPSSDCERIEAFRQGMRELGHVDDQNMTIEPRYAEGNLARIPDLAGEASPSES
jgi:putative tryptophan/tyrosine transport system substrate-binding protein